MTHLSVDPACNTSLLVNKLVERFILRFSGGNPRQGIRRLNCLCIHRARLLFGRFLSSWTFVGRNGCEEHVWWIVSLPPPSTATWAVASLRCSNRLQELRDLSVNTATTVIHCKQHSKSPNAASSIHFNCKVKLKEGLGVEPQMDWSWDLLVNKLSTQKVQYHKLTCY